MMKEVVRAIETGTLAEVGLFAFIVAFVLVVVRVALWPKKERDVAKHMPLNDPPEIDPKQI